MQSLIGTTTVSIICINGKIIGTTSGTIISAISINSIINAILALS